MAETANYDDKVLSPLNWLELDEKVLTMRTAWALDHIEDFGSHLLVRYSAIFVSDKVPAEISHMFGVARAMAIYGALFYPFYWKAIEEAMRVMEAAAKHRADELGFPGPCKNERERKHRLRSYPARLDYLHMRGIMTDSIRQQWDASRSLRNSGSHLKSRNLIDPGNAESMLNTAAMLISHIFEARPLSA